MDNTEAFQDKIILEFEKYLYRQFRDIIDSDLIEAQSYIKKLKDKIIKEDLVNYFDIKHPDLLSKIFDILCKNPGMLIDYKNISNDLNFDWRTIQTYTHYLEEAFLIKKMYNYSPNLLTSEKKLKKIYLNSTSFFT
jgi:predicted AAA+ superfamily ATPase